MTRNEFLKKLKENLEISLDKSLVNEQLDYYDKYISDEIAKGRTEEEIIVELGEPRLIAKTIKTVSNVNTTINDEYINNDYHNYDNNNDNKTDNKTEKAKRYVYSTGGIGCIIFVLLFFIVTSFIVKIFGIALVGVSGAIFGLGPIGIIILMLLVWILFSRR